MSALRRLRAGELMTLAGVICLIVSLLEPWYQGVIGTLTLWNTFGAAAVLLLACLAAGGAVVVTALTERSPALPVSSAIWAQLVGVVGIVTAVVRLLDTPAHASSLCAGPWLALAGTVAITAGAWETIHDEHSSLYDPVAPDPQPRP
jgi:hypothetical protein